MVHESQIFFTAPMYINCVAFFLYNAENDNNDLQNFGLSMLQRRTFDKSLSERLGSNPVIIVNYFFKAQNFLSERYCNWL